MFGIKKINKKINGIEYDIERLVEFNQAIEEYFKINVLRSPVFYVKKKNERQIDGYRQTVSK